MDLSTSVRPRAALQHGRLQHGALEQAALEHAALEHAAFLTSLPREPQSSGRVAKSVFSIRSLVGPAADQHEAPAETPAETPAAPGTPPGDSAPPRAALQGQESPRRQESDPDADAEPAPAADTGESSLHVGIGRWLKSLPGRSNFHLCRLPVPGASVTLLLT